MKYYFIGIKGSGMSTLASLFYDLGNEVIGYDDCLDYKFTMKGLEERSIKIYSPNNLPELSSDTIVTYTAAISSSHHEVKRVHDLGLKIVPYHELIGSLTKKLESICISGTHGKTTTSFMISNILSKSIGCNYFVGDGSGKGDLNSDLFVLESCEYNKHFLSYYPDNVIITNIDLDHTETYPTIEIMIDAYQQFIDKCEKNVIACGDDENILKLNFGKVYFYGLNNNNDLIAKNITNDNNNTYFDVYYKNKLYGNFAIPLFGIHFVLDALASIMVGILYNIDIDIIKDVLKSYKPALRRFNETIINNYIIIDDYAHHPTEIKALYNSAHLKYPNKKINCVFLPNTYSRTNDLFNEFIESLKLFDKAYLMDIKCDRENKEDYPNISSGKLVENIPNSELIDINSVNKLLEYQDEVICFMSCANISPMIEEFKKII